MDVETQRRPHELSFARCSQARAYTPADRMRAMRRTAVLPEWSELIDELRVRHLWQCEACGYAFETTVHFAEVAEAA